MKAIHLVIHGRVQGVFFRKYTLEKANELGLKGMVRNLPSGDVEVFAEGKEEVLKEFVDWCYKGSPASKVESIESFDVAIVGYEKFSIDK
jgi:acylphosphatase